MTICVLLPVCKGKYQSTYGLKHKGLLVYFVLIYVSVDVIYHNFLLDQLQWIQCG